jgi:hypothetical protein
MLNDPFELISNDLLFPSGFISSEGYHRRFNYRELCRAATAVTMERAEEGDPVVLAGRYSGRKEKSQWVNWSSLRRSEDSQLL